MAERVEYIVITNTTNPQEVIKLQGIKPTYNAEGAIIKGAEIFNNGENNSSAGEYSHAEGQAKELSYTYDNKTYTLTTPQANARGAHAEGKSTFANGANSHVEGAYSAALGSSSHAEGGCTNKELGGTNTPTLTDKNIYYWGNVAKGDFSHAEGQKTLAEKTASHAEGLLTQAQGIASHAEGRNTRVIADYGHVEGENTLVSSTKAHAEGYETKATGVAAHAEGCKSKAEGIYSHAEGNDSVASNESSHAEGYKTIASGKGASLQPPSA